MRWWRWFALIMLLLLLASAFAGGYLLGQERTAAALNGPGGFAVLWRVRDLLASDFLGTQPPAADLVQGAAEGLTKTYNDPYTIFVRPAPRRFERDELAGHFGGIGASMGRSQAGDLVLTVMRDRPAARAGIQDGDILLAVGTQPISATMTVQDIVLLVRGEVGSKVTLTLRRGAEQPFSVTITRERIETPSVEWRVLDAEGHIGYLHISIFGERTGQELRTGITELAGQGVNKLVLDLRGNGGGLLDAAVETTSQFLRQGTVLLEQRQERPERFYPVSGVASAAQDWPLVILTDAGTASASEIVAGALRDQGRAVLIGEKTYGKGSVQEVHELPDGSSLHVTVARWLTPERRQLDKVGLEPDVKIGLTEANRNAGQDPQLEQAQVWLRGER